MNKLLTVGALSACLTLTMPVATWANDNQETATAAQENIIKYCNSNNVNIRKEPNIQSEILDKAMLNTSFEIIEEKDGWSKFWGEDENYCGYGYIKSEYLSEVVVTYTQEDLYIMAHVLGGEAQYCTDDEQRYVGSVVLNRVAHKSFPDTIKEVVFEKGQYSCIKDKVYYREPTESNWENAKWLLENGSILPKHVIYQSKGKQGSGVYLKTKWHQYCY